MSCKKTFCVYFFNVAKLTSVNLTTTVEAPTLIEKAVFFVHATFETSIVSSVFKSVPTLKLSQRPTYRCD